MPSFCAVSNCEQKYSQSATVSFHKFPLHNANVLREWIKFTDRGSNWKPSRWSSICSRHFHSGDFRDFLSRKCLKKSAIPTIINKNSISYETYHITTPPDSSQNSRYPDDESDAIASECNDNVLHHEKPINDANLSAEHSTTYCRLCGERIDNMNHAVIGSLDDVEISTIYRKCLPTVNIRQDVDHSNAICSDCMSHLRQYSDFIDKVLSYQREICSGVTSETIFSVDQSFSVNDLICESQIKINNSAGSVMFIKQEPVNVKQEIMDNKKPTEYGSAMTNISRVSPLNTAFITNSQIKESQRINVVEQEIRWPYMESNTNTLCRHCDRIFINNFELNTHKCVTQHSVADRDTTNTNCEIMEIITLNNPISFIDLAEDECGSAEQQTFKKENAIDLEHRDMVDIEHAYAKRLTTTSYNLKQEIELNCDAEISSMSLDESTEGGTSNDEITKGLPGSETATKDIFMCSKCDQEFETLQLLDQHSMRLHSLKNKICSICSAEFKSIYDYLVHKNKVHLPGYQCQQCTRKFTTTIALKKHERFSCSIESKDFYYSCRHCDKCIRNRIKMKEHLRNCVLNKGRPCTKKNSEIRTERKISVLNPDEILMCNKVAQPTQWYACDQCHCSYKKEQSLHRHQKVHNMHGECAETDHHNQILLPMKDKSLTSMVSSKSTLNSVFTDITISLPPIADIVTPANGKFICEICEKSFQTHANLKQHKTTHDQERKFFCTLCPKTFKRLSGLNQHVRGYHYKIKPYTCPVCKYSYALKGDMLRFIYSKSNWKAILLETNKVNTS